MMETQGVQEIVNEFVGSIEALRRQDNAAAKAGLQKTAQLFYGLKGLSQTDQIEANEVAASLLGRAAQIGKPHTAQPPPGLVTPSVPQQIVRQMRDAAGVESAAPPASDFQVVKKGKQPDEEDECPVTFSPKPLSEYSSDTFEQTIGMQTEKDRMMVSVVQPLVYRRFYESQKKQATNVMLYGPGGTGKTRLAKATANKVHEMNAQAGRTEPIPLYAVDSAQIVSKYVGTAPKCLKKVIMTARDTSTNPNGALILFDEADAMLGTPTSGMQSDAPTEKLISAAKDVIGDPEQESNVVIFAITNHPDRIQDPALVSRFPVKVYVGLPDKESRIILLERAFSEKNRSCKREGGFENTGMGLEAYPKWTKIEDVAAEKREDIRKKRENIAILTAGFTPRELNEVARLATGRAKRGIDQLVKLRYVKRAGADNRYDPFFETEAAVKAKERGARVLTIGDLDRLGAYNSICWQEATYKDTEAVLAGDEVLAGDRGKELQKYLDYAVARNDVESAEEIKKHIAEWKRLAPLKEQLQKRLRPQK